MKLDNKNEGWEYIDITPDFKFEEGDCLGLTFYSHVKNLEMINTKDQPVIGVRITKLDGNRIQEVIVFEGPETLTYIDKTTGDRMCAPIDFINNGSLDVMDGDGFKKLNTLIPRVGSDKSHFIMPTKVLRRKNERKDR